MNFLDDKIHLTCYLSYLSGYKKMFPDAHFEVITRSSNHILSPSNKLLSTAKKESWTFYHYCSELLKEWENNDQVIKKIEQLRDIAMSKDLFLVCFEKNYHKCHRSVVKALMLGLTSERILTMIENDELVI